MGSVPGVAILGAGIFTTSQYLPILSNQSSTAPILKAIWSRSKDAAENAASSVAKFFPDVVAKWGEDGLIQILEDSSIHAVAIVLPAQVQLEYVQRALKSGKHVLQEKPIGPTLSDVRDVLSYHSGMGSQAPVWAVAENYRFEPGLIEAARLVKSIGDMMSFEVIVELPMNSSNPYYSSAWRRDVGFKGGFVLDGGVHFVAGLRLITGCEVTQVSAIARHVDPLLPSPDNVSALLQLENECAGVLVMSYSCTARKVSWRVLGSKGTVEAVRDQKDGSHGYLVTFYPLGGTVLSKFFPFSGVENELKAFVGDVSQIVYEGKTAESADKRSNFIEAYHDVAVIEAMLKSSNNKGFPVHVDRYEEI
ncbi:uncharacterized protein YMR315W [Selaginella moellendorffii]|uniref:uncharacterized protein YMR315W n=1 Tax=Selaginella moellendorffii TaxID=88036 RepID=UPI000D1C6477|nr:uncharacterized protein YMR315W [Selaginella moellendorffii]|eukprot:XP_024542125.1 uncharacterized protein YMR315W [Selaginella moellendorffii]